MISIILPFYNDEKCVGKAISSILQQSYKSFELILIDDHSTDNSLKIVQEFNDERIKFFHNKKNLGIAKSRDKAIKIAKGKYLFFTDSDCVADKDWIATGIKTFEKHDCLGVEGKTYYVNKDYKKTISDKMPGDVKTPGQYLGCNMAFTREIMIKLDGYDQKYYYHDDREFAIRVLKLGRIIKNNDMIIIHQKKIWTVKSLIASGKRASDRVLLFKYHNDASFIWFRILYPKNLLKILFPPALIITLLKHKNKTWLDYKLVLASYVFFIYQRYNIWKTAIKERIFVL
jgi:glycosyltransferase involved in cell wall biosynthesis